MKPLLPAATAATADWGGLAGPALALATAELAAGHDGPVLMIAPDQLAADALEAEIAWFATAGVDTLHFPDLETLPYDSFSPHQDIVSERLRVLAALPALERGVVVVPAQSLLQRLPPTDYVAARALELGRGDTLDRTAFLERLAASGYLRVPEVREHGELAVRGSIIDLFPMGTAAPLRIDLFDDDIETLKYFDVDTQRSGDDLNRVAILPAREVPLDADGVRRFRQNYRARFAGEAARSPVYRDVSDGIAHGGVEYYLPLFFDATASLVDYLPAATRVLAPADFDARLAEAFAAVVERYELVSLDADKPALTPAEAFHEPATIRHALAAFPLQQVQREKTLGGHDFGARVLPPLRQAADESAPLADFAHGFDGRILYCAESPGRREALSEYLRDQGIGARRVDDWAGFRRGDGAAGLVVAPFLEGCVIRDAGVAVVPEQAVFGQRVRQRRRRRRAAKDLQAVIGELSDLRPGAPVVHVDYGVGRYLKLATLDIGGYTDEYVTLEYAGGDKLYVPVHSLDRISRYTGAAPEQAPLHRLGSDQWERAQRKAAERARDVAAELLDVYARRAAREGHRFHYSEQDYRAFAGAFPFELTEDQADAIDAIIADMRSSEPMDRVVCGDVGFGKTEVALRAAFIAVEGGKQVAMLVPTTLLAQQHYQTFRDRFADWPFRVEVLSRFRSGRQSDAVLRGLRSGSVDIVIGTHKLLQHLDAFADIGLVIVDEEHRFGVRQKEAIKNLRAEVDVLTLTATPIPRTLNMALGGLRELSLITTPPSDRLSINTFVTPWNDALIREAALREIKRGGQIYFVHNRVEDIERTADKLTGLLPEATLRIGHGQMRETELEQVMVDFYHRRFNLLLCTTIIESGIDIPTANTIIIDRADRFGLAQLHQLRGRVGRSHHRAYAYLLAPPRNELTADAEKRLQAIDSLEDLGAGFTLASHDLEIRGAGELLGDVQSGQIQEIGFSLYTELLSQAVADLKSGREPALDRPLNAGTEVNLHVPALLPEDYVPDVHLRLVLYKRIAGAVDDDALRELKVELIDRFGLLPVATRHLFDATELKRLAEPLGVQKIDVSAGGGYLKFGAAAGVDPATLIAVLQSGPGFRMRDPERLSFELDAADVEQRVAFVRDLLQRLGAGTPATAVAS